MPKGLNGEGLQIGDGEIDFNKFSKILNENFKNIGFIPEIWQGHKDMGKGFWVALEKLNGKILINDKIPGFITVRTSSTRLPNKCFYHLVKNVMCFNILLEDQNIMT